MSEDAAGERSTRSRLAIVPFALGFLGAVVLVVLVARGGSGSEVEAFAAPEDCIQAWNDDEDAKAFARHNFGFHQYTKAEVGYMPAAAGETVVEDRSAGECTVIFARTTLDPEIGYAGQILVKEDWTPLDQILQSADLARLQKDALPGANAKPNRQGDLAELE